MIKNTLLLAATLTLSLLCLLGPSDPATASQATLRACEPVHMAEDDMTYYRSDRWLHADGNVSGWARDEDSPVYDTPECAGVPMSAVTRALHVA